MGKNVIAKIRKIAPEKNSTRIVLKEVNRLYVPWNIDLEGVQDDECKRIGLVVENQLRNQESMMVFKHLDAEEIIPVFSKDKTFRYELAIIREHPVRKTVCTIMENPSYADKHIADKSVNYLERLLWGDIARFHGVQKLIIVNLYAHIQTTNFQQIPRNIGDDNDEHIRQAINQSDIIIIGWGVPTKRDEYVYGLLRNSEGKLIYRTDKHPSRYELREDFIKEILISESEQSWQYMSNNNK